MSELGEVLKRLSEVIAARRDAAPTASYTAKLLAGGPERCAKKFGEEAVETVIAGVSGSEAQMKAQRPSGDTTSPLFPDSSEPGSKEKAAPGRQT